MTHQTVIVPSDIPGAHPEDIELLRSIGIVTASSLRGGLHIVSSFSVDTARPTHYVVNVMFNEAMTEISRTDMDIIASISLTRIFDICVPMSSAPSTGLRLSLKVTKAGQPLIHVEERVVRLMMLKQC